MEDGKELCNPHAQIKEILTNQREIDPPNTHMLLVTLPVLLLVVTVRLIFLEFRRCAAHFAKHVMRTTTKNGAME